MSEHAELIRGMSLLEALKTSGGRDQIPQSDVDQLYGLVLRVADEAGPLLSRIPATFKQYTEHDIRHCMNLLDLCGRLIPPSTLDRLNAVELALLILAILLHDFGMFVSDEEKRETLASREFTEFLHADIARQEAIDSAVAKGNNWEADYLRDAALAEFFRRVHPERAAKNINTYISFPMTYRDLDLRSHVATLAESHGWSVDEPLNISQPTKVVRDLRTNQPAYGVPVNLQYLACCLRLADILDFDRSRTPLAVFKAISFSEERSRLEWKKHLQISGWSVTPTEVAYAAECTHPAFYVAVNQFLDLVDRELQACRRLVGQAAAEISARYELRLSPLVDRTHVEMADRSFVAGGYRFELDYERIMALLMDRSLYGDPSLFVRELVQNAADACRYAAALASAAPAAYTPRITVEEQNVDGRCRIVVSDNGIGMSLQVFLDYFMRVGRSFYRSRDFLVVRTQLASSGIELDATSQFGIGILSCFMVADGLEVETYRRGNAPLRITVDGPTKYFVIQQLPERRPRDFESPDEPHVGPPQYPGTRVALTITKVREVDVVATLKAAAANLEFDVMLVDAAGGQTVLPRDGWETAPTDDDVQSAFGHSTYLSYGPDWELHERVRRDRHDSSVYNVLTPSVVQFASFECTRSFRGAAWLWLLRGDDGSPAPSKGYLRVGNKLDVRGVPAILGRLVEATRSKFLVFPELRRLGETLSSMVPTRDLSDDVRDRLYALYSDAEDEDQDPDELTEDFTDSWQELTEADRGLLSASLRALNDQPANWRNVPGLAERLLAGDNGWSTEAIEFTGDLPFSALPQRYATFGMVLPGGILRWDPSAGFARKVRIFDGPVGLKVDFRGASSPRPAANRLFVEAIDASNAAVSVIRCVIRHAAALATQGNTKAWQRWFRILVGGSASLPYWNRAMLGELPVIESLPVYDVADSHITGDAIREKFGRWLTVESRNFAEVQVRLWTGLNGQLLALRPQQSSGEKRVVDMESVVAPKQESFHQSGRFDDILGDL